MVIKNRANSAHFFLARFFYSAHNYNSWSLIIIEINGLCSGAGERIKHTLACP